MAVFLEQAIAAYEQGNMAECISLLEPYLLTSADARVAMLLGEASRQAGNDAMLERASDRLVALDPAAIRPFIWKGDILWKKADKQRASQFYAAALARAQGKPLTASLQQDVQRIQSLLADLRSALSDFLNAYLSRQGYPPEKRTARISRSIDILTGRLQADMQLQQPTVHFLPDLPHISWYDTAQFSWVANMESKTHVIRDELLAVLQDGQAFAPYIEGDTHGPARNYQGLLNNPAWSAFYLWRDGKAVPENIARCPQTAAALEAVPRPDIPSRSPTAMFSLLAPGTYIPPHHGMLNARLIAHLPLIVPEKCAMRVGRDTRAWQVGKIALFDDSVEHEAWNHSHETRVVLLFDVARPELDADEQRMVALCFAAVDAYKAASGAQP